MTQSRSGNAHNYIQSTQAKEYARTMKKWCMSQPSSKTKTHEVSQFEQGSGSKAITDAVTLTKSGTVATGSGVVSSKRTIVRPPFGIKGRQKPVPASREQRIDKIQAATRTCETLEAQLREWMETSEPKLNPDAVIAQDEDRVLRITNGNLVSRQQPTGPTKGGL
tara:strand:- start:745 stop:1239 length:495 start_codon:yes stop_codon:yes gene_type:complete